MDCLDKKVVWNKYIELRDAREALLLRMVFDYDAMGLSASDEDIEMVSKYDKEIVELTKSWGI